MSLVPESLDKIFDFGIKGEGEVPFYNVLRIFLEKGKISTEDLKKIKGAVFYDQNDKLQVIPDQELFSRIVPSGLFPGFLSNNLIM